MIHWGPELNQEPQGTDILLGARVSDSFDNCKAMWVTPDGSSPGMSKKDMTSISLVRNVGNNSPELSRRERMALPVRKTDKHRQPVLG